MTSFSALVAVGLASLLLMIPMAACGDAAAEAVVEYPESGAPPAADAGADARLLHEAGADGSAPVTGTKLLDGPVSIEGVTSDGDLVLAHVSDIKVLAAGGTDPFVVVRDFHSDTDNLLVRGRFAAAWLGDGVLPKPLTIWARTGGVQTIAALSYQSSFYPKSAADDFAYTGPTGGSSLRRNVWATKAGAGAGAKVVNDLDTGIFEPQCRVAITWSAAALLVGGCPNGSTTPSVAVYSLDGSGPIKTVLDGSAPGVWPNRARTHALVQTATASSLRALAGNAAPLPLDGPVAQAFFSADDATVVYRRADQKVRRAATTTPSAAADVIASAISLLAVSGDARFSIVATKGNTERNDSDLVLADALAPGAPRVLAPEKAVFYGLSRSGAHAVWLTRGDLGVEGPLYVGALAGGAPVKVSNLATRVDLEGDVIYWQERDDATRTHTLKAARVSRAADVIEVQRGLDPITAATVVIANRLFIATKLGLWAYPATLP